MAKVNKDPAEIAKFEALASAWWDPKGDFRTLHDINPARVEWIIQRSPVANLKLLDVGCGGGLVTEAMAKAGAKVTGIDLSEMPLEVARKHAKLSDVSVTYKLESAESMAEQQAGSFDIVTCLEVLEHVPDPALTVDACARLVRPGGHLYFSTINRNLRAWLLAIIAAEHLLKLLPVGTHHYDRLIKPSELASYARNSNLQPVEIAGMHYNPFRHQCRFNQDPGVNYFMHCQPAPKPAEPELTDDRSKESV